PLRGLAGVDQDPAPAAGEAGAVFLDVELAHSGLGVVDEGEEAGPVIVGHAGLQLAAVPTRAVTARPASGAPAAEDSADAGGAPVAEPSRAYSLTTRYSASRWTARFPASWIM